jgi:hypothetical protein
MDEEDNPGHGCTVGRCDDDEWHDWRWDIPGTDSFYCISCIARSLRDVMLDQTEEWPPSLEGNPVPVEDFTERLLELEAEGYEEEVDGEAVRIFYGIGDNFREMDRYRSRVLNHYERIFCPHPPTYGYGRPYPLVEVRVICITSQRHYDRA